jgi:hypothetical protein
MKKMKLKVEELEERIAPSFVFLEGSQPDLAGADPIGGQGGLEGSFGADSNLHPTGDAWIAHTNGETPLDNGGNA